jgi:hypothetical protein
MMRILRPLFVLAALAAFPTDAAAQMEFAGIPWGTPPQETADQLQSRGYQPRGVDQDGDWVFRAPDSAEVVAMMDSAGLVSVAVRWYDHPERFPARLEVLRDSLVAAFGPPINDEENGGAWRRDGAWAHLNLRGMTGGLDSMLFLAHTGPRGHDEEVNRRGALAHARRERLREQGPDSVAVGGWLRVWDEIWHSTLVDTARYTTLGHRVYGARMLVRWQETLRLENGMQYDAVITEVELDCPGLRSRLLRTIPLFYEVPLAVTEIPQPERRWFAPGTGSMDAFLIKRACAALDRHG